MAKERVLLVDDEPDFVRLLSSLLEMHDFAVDIARTGEEALEKVKEKPDIILLDIILPKMNGHAVCCKLREDKTTRDIPIIMLTAKSAHREKVGGLHIGADDYITKPFEIEELLARIKAVLRRIRSFEEDTKEKPQAINEIKRIIHKGLIVQYFQPIFYLHPQRLLGVEVLSRPPANSYFSNAEILFDTAFQVGMLFDLELVCHKKALRKLEGLTKKNLVFFNINPFIIQDPTFNNFVRIYRRYTNLESIVLELSERTAIKDFDTFSQTLKFLKKKGFKIAIDDLGSGYASLNSVVEIEPNFVKIDMHIIRNIQTDPLRQNVLDAIVNLCKQSEIITIAEGIESSSELDVLIKHGVDVGQGYFLSGFPSK